MKTSELTGAALDWAVAVVFNPAPEWGAWSPSTNWAQGGPIIERECIEISCIHTTGWTPNSWDARHPQRIYAKGTTPLIAAMRCYVASKLGDEVEIPNELIGDSHECC